MPGEDGELAGDRDDRDRVTAPGANSSVERVEGPGTRAAPRAASTRRPRDTAFIHEITVGSGLPQAKLTDGGIEQPFRASATGGNRLPYDRLSTLTESHFWRAASVLYVEVSRAEP